MKSFIIKYNPYILLSVPCLLVELFGIITVFSGKYLVTEFLLQIPTNDFEISTLGRTLFILLEILYIGGSLIFLYPVFKAHKTATILSSELISTIKTRIYNFPSLLILYVWSLNFIENCIFYFFKPAFYADLPFIYSAIISTTLTAIFIYYTAEYLNRFVLIPHWFSDGKFKVSWKIRVPSLFLRFGDTFLVSGILPILSILGVIVITIQQGKHDPDELRRLLFVCASLGATFWVFGGVLTFLNSRTFLNPLLSMEKTLKEFSKGNFRERIVVHSDDQLGVLEQAVNQMGGDLEEKEIIKTIFGHYVSPAVRDLILGGKVNTEGDKIEAVILFSDIRSFTSLSEVHPPENIVKLLNIHFTRIVDIVSRNDGFVDKFIGDAVMAVFDEELTQGRHKLSALKAAAEILTELETTNQEIASLGFSPLKIGIGIASGPVIRGNIGSENRREMTVIGDTVNLASRLESATKEYGSPILVTESSFDIACENYSPIQKIAEETLIIRGKADSVKVFLLDLLK